MIPTEDDPSAPAAAVRCLIHEPLGVAGTAPLKSNLSSRSDRSPYPDADILLWSTNANLFIEWISGDVEAVLGRSPQDLIGRSMLQVVHANAPDLARACNRARRNGTPEIIQVTATPRGGRAMTGRLLVLAPSQSPHPSFALLVSKPFAAVEEYLNETEPVWGCLEGRLDQLDVARSRSEATKAQLSGRPRLSNREVAVVEILMGGDRVPVIAKALFITQSTVRNHLYSVYRKLDVHSQQQLVTLLREPSRPGRS